jgi:chromosomal replication initiation ATPase DnaA
MTAIADIIREVAAAHGVSPDTLRSREQPYRLSKARRTAYRRLRDERKLSYTRIAALMGGRDRTAIIHALRESSPRAATVPA